MDNDLLREFIKDFLKAEVKDTKSFDSKWSKIPGLYDTIKANTHILSIFNISIRGTKDSQNGLVLNNGRMVVWIYPDTSVNLMESVYAK
jgi:hypothetical protein